MKTHIEACIYVHPETGKEAVGYLLCQGDTEGKGWVWINGHPFGFPENIKQHDHSSNDCRYLLVIRPTPESVFVDVPKERAV